MKVVVLFFLVLCSVTGSEIRGYKIGLEITENHPAKSIEAPFESRFFTEGAELLDYTEWARKVWIAGEEEGRAIYNKATGRMVIRATRGRHVSIRGILTAKIDYSIRTEVSLFLIPGVAKESRGVRWNKPSAGVKLLRSLSCLHLPGAYVEAKTPDGRLSFETEAHVDSEHEIVDYRMTVKANLSEATFDWKSGAAWPAGIPMAHEVGSMDGKNTLIMVVKHDLVLEDGSSFYEWILKEEGGAFLLEERLAANDPTAPKKEISTEFVKGVHRFAVFETLEAILLSPYKNVDEDDPFGDWGDIEEIEYQGRPQELANFEDKEYYDLRDLMGKNGLAFEKDDFVLLAKGEDVVYAKLPRDKMELLEELLCMGSDPPQMIRVALVEIVAGVGSDDDYWKAKDAKVARKMSQILFPGQVGRLTFGEDLAFEIETQFDADLVEVRMSFTEQGGDFDKASFKTGATLQSGKPSLIQESRVGGVRKAWVVTATVIAIEEEIVKIN